MCALTMFAGMLGLYKRRRSIVQHHIWLLTACTRSTVNASHKDQPTNEPLHCARHIGFSPIMTTEIKRVIEHWMMADTLHLGSKNKCSWWRPIIQGKEHIILSLISLTCQAIGCQLTRTHEQMDCIRQEITYRIFRVHVIHEYGHHHQKKNAVAIQDE